MLCPRLQHFLDERHAHYATIPHERAFTAHETAAAAHVPYDDFAKTVMMKVDGRLAMMVVPGSHRVDLARLAESMEGHHIELAHEWEFKDAFPDCEVGAMPPFGNLYGVPVYVDSRLAGHQTIVFNAGSHTDLVRMAYGEFERLVQPRSVRLVLVM